MVSLQQLLNFSGDTLDDTAGVWHNVADSLAEHTTALQNQVREQLDNGVWSGDAGDAARDHLDRLNAQHTQHEQTLRTIAGTLHAANTGITTAQSALNQALSVAEQAGLEVGTDGSVSWNLPQTINLLTNPGELATIAG